MQFIRDLREVKGALKELVAVDEVHEKHASFDLAVSARRFSQETKEVVDDKLTFSATLMRAGEVDAATRLLAEVEAEVRDNEIALIEQVNEVKVARAARRERITRMRLARSLAVAMLGAAVMAMSAVGMAFASFIEDRSQSVAAASVREAGGREVRAAAPRGARPEAARHMQNVHFRGMKLALTPVELRAYQQLTSGDVDVDRVEHLLSLLPHDLAHSMSQVLATGKVAEKAVEDASPAAVSRAVARARAKAEKAQSAQANDQPKDDTSTQQKDDPSDEPSPGDDEESQEEPEEDPDGSGLPPLTEG
ncbi:MAG: hypothetical protein M3273_06290 [Actinomycetota bacterium]|nr:hypothetical protein [Actinomycetota bacterium]